MAVNFTYKTTNHIITQSVTLGDNSTYDNYVFGVHGSVHATDDSDDTTTKRLAIFYTTPPSDISSASNLTAFDDLSEIPDSVKTYAEAMLADTRLTDQMTEDLENERKNSQSAIAPWS
tara:strand:- start:1073 stop:1426 length:354 start_codon:yes stop_codon:yes gene_type:complete